MISVKVLSVKDSDNIYYIGKFMLQSLFKKMIGIIDMFFYSINRDIKLLRYLFLGFSVKTFGVNTATAFGDLK